LLGIQASGKSTFAKQMKLILANGFSNSEVEQYKTQVRQNILIGMQELIGLTEKLELSISSENKKRARLFKEMTMAETRWDEHVATRVKQLWVDTAIQEAIKESLNHHMQMTHMDYWINSIDRISSADYVPLQQDILRARQRTTGKLVTEIFAENDQSNILWRFIDVGGQKPERAKWGEMLREEFRKLHAVIYFVAMDEYNTDSTEVKDKTKVPCHPFLEQIRSFL